MGDTLDHTLVNPNQLHNDGTSVQDNAISESPLSIITEDGEFSMELLTEENILFSNTHTPSDNHLRELPHINIISPHP